MTVICKKCGEEFKSSASLGTHLWKTHSMDPKTYYDQYLKRPEEGICPVCSSPTRFRTLGKGYLTWCSRKCSAQAIKNDSERNSAKVNAMRETMVRKFGVDSASKCPELVDKQRATMKKRYGVEFYAQSKDFGKKFVETYMSRHGMRGPTADPAIQAKIRETNMRLKGVPYNFSINVQKENEEYTRFLDEHGCDLVKFNFKKSITYRCRTCGSVCTEQDLFIKSRIASGRKICVVCDPKHAHTLGEELEIARYIESLGFEVTHYDRGFLGKYGADIVVESKKVIVEYDGLFWHSELNVANDYHLEKTELAEKMGYRLIHVFADEWNEHFAQVKSRLANILGVIGTRIYARKCKLVKPSYHETMEFVASNHTQGSCPFMVGYGLEYDGRLVAVMTFIRDRFSKGRDGVELLRYCTLPGINVVGGAGRLFKAFVKEYSPKKVTTFADRRWSPTGSFYESIGFRQVGTTRPAYSYVVGDTRMNRMGLQKHKLVNRGADSSKSAAEILMEQGIYRIYDCGNFKYEWLDDGN